MVLERKDNVVDLCEMKFFSSYYRASDKDEADLRRKKEVLSSFLGKRQSIQTVLVTTFGLSEGKYRFLYQNVILLPDLFEKA